MSDPDFDLRRLPPLVHPEQEDYPDEVAEEHEARMQEYEEDSAHAWALELGGEA